MSQRINDRISGQGATDRMERLRKAHQTGEYIDEHTAHHDTRTTDEILSRVPKCCQEKKDDEPSPTK